MTASNREASISKTLTYEGGFTNDPRDPGGATNWGITITDARKYWKPDASPADVKAMPKSVAVEIYRQKYWAKIDCDSRPVGPDFVDFDYSVNSGPGRVTKLRAKLDPKKLAPAAYVRAACAERSSFLHGLKTFSVFGNGWSKRVADVEATGVRMAVGAAGKPVVPVLEKHAADHAKKAIAHSTAGATAGTAVPSLPHTLPSLLTHIPTWELVALGYVALLVIGYFVWNAVQHGHRANAYMTATK
ncbi:MAG: glycoside hydrolase family 108 protein [Hyphomicrobiales bacterium]